jgi:adenosine kinase
MTQRVGISGSVAFDNIMVFEGHFKDHILADKVHMLNVSFLTPSLKRQYGGCAANIAYTLAGLGGSPVVLATVGMDGQHYLDRMKDLNIDISVLKRLDDCYTPQCFITTDLSDNQITAFHPGAMAFAHQVQVNDAPSLSWGIVSPNGKDAMLSHSKQFKAAGAKLIFDPGQALPMFDGEELKALIGISDALTLNDYEAQLVCDRTGWSETVLAEHVQALIITKGAEGSVLYLKGQASVTIANVAISKAVDPTGCGDAYRGGLLYGLAKGWSWLDSARLGSVMGAIKIEQSGAQNHALDWADIRKRYQAAFASACPR